MKNLILFLVLVTFSFSKDWLGGHQNPNGKPFTLTIGWYLEQGRSSLMQQLFLEPESGDVSIEGRLNVTLPISSLFTIKLAVFKDRGYESAESIRVDHNQYDDELIISHYNAHGEDGIWIRSIGGELHLPIYKLWEK